MTIGNKYKESKSILSKFWLTFKWRLTKPPYPKEGHLSLYFKSDKSMWVVDSNGDETAVLVTVDTVGFGVPEEVTLETGVIEVTGINNFRHLTVDTEDGDATDNFTTLNGGNVGELCIIQCADNARSVVCKKGTSLKLQGDFTLNNIYDQIMLKCLSDSVWVEISRSSNS